MENIFFGHRSTPISITTEKSINISVNINCKIGVNGLDLPGDGDESERS